MMNSCNQAVILAGGLGTRVSHIYAHLPKSLIPIAGRPFIFHQLDLLKKNSVRDIVMLVGHKGDQLERAIIESGYADQFSFTFSSDGPELLGTAGSVRHALANLDDNFLILYGDSYLECDYQRIWRKFTSEGRSALMTVFRNDSKWDTSNVAFDGREILAYSKSHRSKDMNFIDYGLSFFKKEAFVNHVPENVNYDLAALFSELLKNHDLSAFEVDQRFYEIGSPDGIRQLEEHLLK